MRLSKNNIVASTILNENTFYVQLILDQKNIIGIFEEKKTSDAIKFRMISPLSEIFRIRKRFVYTNLFRLIVFIS